MMYLLNPSCIAGQKIDHLLAEVIRILRLVYNLITFKAWLNLLIKNYTFAVSIHI